MRSNTRDAARRATLSLTRATITSTTDTTKIQNVSVRGHYNELIPNVERLQTYGHTSVPMPPDQTDAAHAIVGFINANRSNPVVLAVDDRRYRQTHLQPGDVCTYHHSGANQTFSDKGLKVDMGSAKKPLSLVTGNGSLYISDATATIQNSKAKVEVQAAKINAQLKNTSMSLDGTTITSAAQNATVTVSNGTVTSTAQNATVKIENGKITCTVGGTSIILTDGKISLGGEGASIPVALATGLSTLVFATR